MTHDSKGRWIGPPLCQYRSIDPDLMGSCGERQHVESGTMLCIKHLRYLARRAGYVPQDTLRENANKMATVRIAQQDAEIERLKATIAHLRKPKPAKPAVVNGILYFLRSNGHVKIGWTSNLENRMKGYPPDTVLLAVMPGTRKDENALHRKFAHLRTHGREWYPLAPQITEEVDRVVKEHGAPPIVDFSARRAQRIVGPRLNSGGPKPRTWGHIR